MTLCFINHNAVSPVKTPHVRESAISLMMLKIPSIIINDVQVVRFLNDEVLKALTCYHFLAVSKNFYSIDVLLHSFYKVNMIFNYSFLCIAFLANMPNVSICIVLV